MRLRMELFAKIRRDARFEGASIRELAKRYQIGRDTIRQALVSPVPPARKVPVRSSPRPDLTSVVHLIPGTPCPGKCSSPAWSSPRGSIDPR